MISHLPKGVKTMECLSVKALKHSSENTETLSENNGVFECKSTEALKCNILKHSQNSSGWVPKHWNTQVKTLKHVSENNGVFECKSTEALKWKQWNTEWKQRSVWM